MKVQYIDHMGDDNRVCDTARISFSRKANEYSQEANDKLIAYLARESHWSPFSHVFVSLAMQASISIRTQCMKHTVGFAFNEVSRRYINTTPELFIPTFRHKPDGSIKQGSGEVINEITSKVSVFDEEVRVTETQETLQHEYEKICQSCIEHYEYLIGLGVAPEQARFVLPQGVETSWVWTGSLYAWARFYNLRKDSHAQKEIQELAHMVGNIIEPLFPKSWKALT